MIYLASRSPRRVELLRQLGVSSQIFVDEDEARAEALEERLPGEVPSAYVVRVAAAKARSGHERRLALGLPAAPLLAADTTVAIGSTILGKPVDRADAIRLLRCLSGRTHRVMTAVVVVTPGGRLLQALQRSQVRFARLRADWIAAYVDSGEPFGKAGGYAIQGHAAAVIRSIDGSHSGIMGLPLFETAELLQRAGLTLDPSFQPAAGPAPRHGLADPDKAPQS